MNKLIEVASSCVCVLSFAACAQRSAPVAEAGGAKAAVAKSEADSAAESAELLRQVDISVRKLDHARMQAEIFSLASVQSVAQAEREVGIAEAKLAHLKGQKMPIDIAEKELDLRQVKDRAAEAAEELKQIELMYKDQDLDDKTAEYVVARGRRNAERAAEAIRIEQQRLDAFKNVEMPLEFQSLESELMAKRAALEKARQEARAGSLEKEIGIASIESELTSQRDKLARLEKKGAQP